MEMDRIKNFILSADVETFRFVNIKMHNGFLAGIAGLTANDVFLTALVFTGIFFLAGKAWREKKAVIAFTLWSIIAVNIISGLLKHAFKRPRPYLSVDGAMLLVKMYKNGFAFPSTHTAMATVICAMLWDDFPGARGCLAAFTALVGFFCVYTGGHYPLDVIAGFTLGLVTAAAASYLKKHYLNREQGEILK
jgi:undecaprenyl-diphosphatase